MGKWVTAAEDEHSLLRLKYPGRKFFPDMTDEELLSILRSLGECTELDSAVRHLLTMDEEQTRLTDDWDNYFPAIQNIMRSRGASPEQIAQVDDIATIAKQNYLSYNDCSELLKLLTPSVSHKEWFDHPDNDWEIWWNYCIGIELSDLRQYIEMGFER